MVENLSEVSVRSDLAVVDCNEGIVILKVDFFLQNCITSSSILERGDHEKNTWLTCTAVTRQCIPVRFLRSQIPRPTIERLLLTLSHLPMR